MKTILLFRRSGEVLKVVANLKFSFSDFLFIDVKTWQKISDSISDSNALQMIKIDSLKYFKLNYLSPLKRLYLLSTRLCGVMDSTMVFGTIS
nr:hypothetical protein [Ignavibacteria bacterium]HMR41565.1 hypothetical protein [Ignavibacteria bacterium]